MRVWARRNHVGWIHLWRDPAAFEAGEASDHFFDGRTDPRWAELDPEVRGRVEAGGLVELEDPGWLEDSE